MLKCLGSMYQLSVAVAGSMTLQIAIDFEEQQSLCCRRVNCLEGQHLLCCRRVTASVAEYWRSRRANYLAFGLVELVTRCQRVMSLVADFAWSCRTVNCSAVGMFGWCCQIDLGLMFVAVVRKDSDC